MTPEQIFALTNPLAALGWILLLALPGRRWATLAAGRVLPLVFAAGYLVIFVTHFFDAPGGFSTLEGVASLFANRWLLLAGWVHYLAFDLVVGTWETEDARARGLSRWLVAPCLVLTFLVGPVGFLCYHVVARSSGVRTA